MRRVLAATLAMAIALPAAFAAPKIIVAPDPVPPPATAPTTAAKPPYEDQLLRLSEILGAVHYLRQLCKANEGNVWREQMEALIATEQPDDMRRARMIDRFNRGYDGFKSVYLTCTPAATLAVDRYLQEGARTAADITARYGK